MFKIQTLKDDIQVFVYDLEFIGDVKNPTTCKIWDLCIHHIQSNSTFNALIDPQPGCNYFEPPPSEELFHVTRDFLNRHNAMEFSIVFNKMIRWIDNRCFKSNIPILISHNNFSSDKLVIEHECYIRNILIPPNWFFFDSLIYFRDHTRTINNEYSLKSLVKCILGRDHTNAHRAYADTMALTDIIKQYTNEDYSLLLGNIYMPYKTSLRTINGIGKMVEMSFEAIGIESKEQLIKFIRFLYNESFRLQIEPRNYISQWIHMISQRIPDEVRNNLVNQLFLLIQ